MSLTVVISPMFSGKTTHIINEVSILSSLSFKSIIFNHSIDNRSKEVLSCHNKNINLEVKPTLIFMKKTDDLQLENVDDFDYVFIDEFQFFNKPNTIDVILGWVDKGKNVTVAGLKGDFLNRPFGFMMDIIPHADNIIVKHSFCVLCARNDGLKIQASFSKRINIDKDNQVLVGEQNEYIPVCRKHYK
jgi:thymidine kinase